MGNFLSRPLTDQPAQAARPCQKETYASPEPNHDETFHDAIECPTLPVNRKRKRDSLWTEEDLTAEQMTSAEKCRLFLNSLEKPQPTRSSLNPMGHQTKTTDRTYHQTSMPVTIMVIPESEVPVRGPGDNDRRGSKKRVRFRSDSELLSSYHQAAEERGSHKPTKKGHDVEEHSREKKSTAFPPNGLSSELMIEEATRQTDEEVVSPEQNAISIPYVPTRAEFYAEKSAEKEKERKAHQLRTLESQKKKKTTRRGKSGPMAFRSERQIKTDNAMPRYNLVQYAEDGSLLMYSPSASDPADAKYIQIMDTIPCKKGCWIKTIPARGLGHGRELTQTEFDTLDSKLEDANCGCVVCADLGVEECLQEGRYPQRMTESVDHAGLDGYKHGYDQYKKFQISGFEWD